LKSSGFFASALLGFALVASCKSDGGGVKIDGGAKDKGGHTEAQIPDLGADQGASPDAGAADQGGGPEGHAATDSGKSGDSKGGSNEAGSTTCDPTCQASDLTTCVQDSSGDCVECLTDADCAANPAAYGPTCDTSMNYCTCASNSDCAKNLWGKSCDSSAEVCSCASSSDCGSGTFASTCDTSYGFCSCSSDSDCSSNRYGLKCDTTNNYVCTCAGTSDCPSGETCTGSLGSGAWTYCR
jgi:hypothetical protein